MVICVLGMYVSTNIYIYMSPKEVATQLFWVSFSGGSVEEGAS